MRPQASSGSITLEMAVVVPLLFFLLFGGTAVAHSALARASLQMTVMRAARELAAGEAAGRMQPDQVYWYREFTETYGLPRAKVRMVTGQTRGMIVVGACYRVRIPLPSRAGLGQQPIPWPLEFLRTALEAEGADPQQARETVESLAAMGRAVESAVGEGQTAWSQAAAFWERLKGLQLRSPLVRSEFLPIQGARVSDLDAYLPDLCAGRGISVSARSAFWSERSVPLPAPPPPLEVVRLEPNPAHLRGVAPPGVRATITVRAKEPTTCEIRVRYRTGLSQASGLQGKVDTRPSGDGHLAEWQWNVGTQTTPGEWPVWVGCDNGQWTTAYLKVTR